MKALQALRDRKKLTQQQVADLLGVSRSTYAKWEIGKREPDYAILLKIADLFDITTDYLLDRPNAVVSYTPEETHDPVEGIRIAMEKILTRPVKRADVETILDAYDRLTRPD